ncbi:MAG: HD-GYP domain-containing protein [bacterium]|nr:HD-GYP domain-containing protein [bacterium]
MDNVALNSIILFAASFTFFICACYIIIYLKHKLLVHNRSFAVFFFSVFIFIFGEFYLNVSRDFQSAIFWSKFQTAGVMLMIASFPLAIYSYLRKSLRSVMIRIFVGISGILLFLLFFSNLIITDIPYLYGGMLLQPMEGKLYPVFLGILGISVFHSYGNLIYQCFFRKFKYNKLILISITIAIITAAVDIIRIYYPIRLPIVSLFTYGTILMTFAFGYYLLDDFIRIYKYLEVNEREIRKLNFESKIEFFNLLELIATTLEAKDNYTAGHSERVTRYSLMIADALRLTEKEKDNLKTAGLLHDIGKIGVSEKILNKPGKLTEDEYNDVKKHPTIGVDILSKVHEFITIIAYVLYHHERPDGKGYPLGLKSDEIPLLAKIISVADVFDALTSDRPYRQALSKPKAIEILREVSGSQLEADLVDIFIQQITQVNH